MAEIKRTFWKKVGSWTMRRFRTVITRIVMDELVPLIQEKVKAGAVDKQVDALIRAAAEEYIVKKL